MSGADVACDDALVAAGAIDRLRHLAEWSEWVPFGEATLSAPRSPGVYVVREGELGAVIYVGMAGERAGRTAQGKPKGLRGRLSVYASGKAAVSGLGEAAFDRALADAAWIRDRLAELERDGPQRTKVWARDALVRADLQVCWAVTVDKAAAKMLETEVLIALADQDLWNRAR